MLEAQTKMRARVLYLFIACFFLLSGFTGSKHPVRDGVRLISLGHQIRRVLVRAERANLKTATVKDEVRATQTPALFTPPYQRPNSAADRVVIPVAHTPVADNFASQSYSILNL